MKAIDLATDLLHMVSVEGKDMEVILQDSPPNAHPECCKHEFFYVVAEPKDGNKESGMEIVIRTWPY